MHKRKEKKKKFQRNLYVQLKIERKILNAN